MAEPALAHDVDDIDESLLVTEDDEPVDNIFSEKQQALLTESLYASWGPERSFVALANVGLFFSPDEEPYVPDMLLSLDVRVPEDVWKKKNRSYFIWRYGKPPELVVEVVSNRDRHEERKILGYARLGIAYYVIYDPAGQLGERALRVYELHGTRYVEVVPPRWLPGLNLGVVVWEGEYRQMRASWLRWCEPSGRLLPTGEERADQERARADQEQERAEQERGRADAAEARAKRLEERLREAGLSEAE